MKRSSVKIILGVCSVLVMSLSAYSQTSEAYEGDEAPDFRSRKLVGPRLGMTFVVPDNGPLVQRLKERNMNYTSSQFGWHFEWLVEPKTGGPAFVVECIPFVGGVEYGMLIPSTSLVMGIRLPSGYEFGMGPMGYYTGDRNKWFGSSLVMAVGKSLEYRGVNIPLNLAVATNPEGHRVSFVFGYALSEKKQDRRRYQ
jgi:hypothetical protein